MSDALSLTQQEAAERAGLLSVRRYDIEVDLTGLLEGSTLRTTSRIEFDCPVAGASTFVDCVAEIHSATLDGMPVDHTAVSGGRLPLTDLGGPHVLVVEASQPDTGSAQGILRTVDPSDKLVYVWTSFEPDDARRVWACFDQPDLKAPHRFTVTAPEAWTVTSNGAPERVSGAGDGARVWEFPDTPPLSTYVVVVNAGPFHELRSRRGGHDLGLYSRQSLRTYLERDAEELFDLTARGLGFFGERFGSPFPQERYDQVFVPNMGGAMENWGCVTWTDAMLYRSHPTYAQRAQRASVLLHEMAHMWFGDLVTMRWWDDLWLNEAFASWAATWASVGATEFVDAWAGFLVGLKLEGYRMDMSPATHPIRGQVPDVAQAMANFDAITYVKGESVLKQLVAYVGEDAFVAGLRAYFREHAWGNTVLRDLMTSIGRAAARDLDGWTTAWLDTAGTDTLTLDGGVLRAAGPGGPDGGSDPRPHRLHVSSWTAGDRLVRVGTRSVETSGPATPVDLPDADLHLVNADDLTFAAGRPADDSMRLARDRAADFPDPLSRGLVVVTAWDMLVRGELAPAELVACVTGALDRERSPVLVEPFLALAGRAAEQWSPIQDIPGALARVASAAAGLADVPEHRQPALRTLATAATTADHLALLDAAATDDLDLAWRVAARRAELGEYDEAVVTALEERDPDPDAPVRALGVRGARPDADAKEEVWQAVLVDRSVPVGLTLQAVASLFWRPTQAQLLRPFTHRYLERAAAFSSGGMLALGSVMRIMFPTAVADQAFLDEAAAIAARPDLHPAVRSVLLTNGDTVRRILLARAR